MKKIILILCTIIFITGNLFAKGRQDILDDGFTWFEAVNGEALGGNNIPYSTGWYLKIKLRVLGEYPTRSAFKITVSKANTFANFERIKKTEWLKTKGLKI